MLHWGCQSVCMGAACNAMCRRLPQATVYDGMHMDGNVSIVVHFVNEATEHAPGGVRPPASPFRGVQCSRGTSAPVGCGTQPSSVKHCDGSTACTRVHSCTVVWPGFAPQALMREVSGVREEGGRGKGGGGSAEGWSPCCDARTCPSAPGLPPTCGRGTSTATPAW